LIIERMGCRDTSECPVCEELPEKSVAQLAGRGFQAQVFCCCMLADVAVAKVNLQAVLLGEGGHKQLVSLRLVLPKFVVEVNDGDDDSEFVPKFKCQPQERDGIQASGNSNAYAVTRRQQLMLSDVRQNCMGQRLHPLMVHLR